MAAGCLTLFILGCKGIRQGLYSPASQECYSLNKIETNSQHYEKYNIPPE